MNSHEVASQYFTTAQNQLLERIKLRETGIFVWLGFLGTVFTVAFAKEQARPEVLLIVPPAALGFLMRVFQHETLIARLAEYCCNELGPFLEPEDLTPERRERLRQWDASDTLHKFQRTFVEGRGLMYFVLFVASGIAAIAWNARAALNGGAGVLLWVTLDAATTVVAASLVYRTTRRRIRSSDVTRKH